MFISGGDALVSRKYTGDYRLENITTSSGKVKTIPVYKGEWFAFCADASVVQRTKRLFPAFSAVIAALFLLVLLMNAPSGHIYYVMVPFAVMIFPVYFALAAAYRLLTAKEKVTREHRDKLVNRYITVSLFLMVFSAASTVGHIIYCLNFPPVAKDFVSLSCAAVICALSAWMFFHRNDLKMEKV